MTLDALAERAGISASHLSRLERSQTLPSFTVLAKIAEVLDVEIDEFVRLERDVTLLDAELGRYLDLLGVTSPVRDELFALSIEARQALVERLRRLSEAMLTPLPTQEAVGRALGQAEQSAIWADLQHHLRQAGLSGPAFARAWMRLLETPGRREILVMGRSFFLLPPGADLAAAYRAVFRGEPLDPLVATIWERSGWVRDPAVVRRWPTRMLLRRGVLERALAGSDAGGVPGLARAGARRLGEQLLDRLEQDPGFALALTDADLGPFNAFAVDGQGGLLEQLPARARTGTVRSGLWVSGPELTGALVALIQRLWDDLAPEDRAREPVAAWLRARLAEAER